MLIAVSSLVFTVATEEKVGVVLWVSEMGGFGCPFCLSRDCCWLARVCEVAACVALWSVVAWVRSLHAANPACLLWPCGFLVHAVVVSSCGFLFVVLVGSSASVPLAVCVECCVFVSGLPLARERRATGGVTRWVVLSRSVAAFLD